MSMNESLNSPAKLTTGFTHKDNLGAEAQIGEDSFAFFLTRCDEVESYDCFEFLFNRNGNYNKDDMDSLDSKSSLVLFSTVSEFIKLASAELPSNASITFRSMGASRTKLYQRLATKTSSIGYQNVSATFNSICRKIDKIRTLAKKGFSYGDMRKDMKKASSSASEVVYSIYFNQSNFESSHPEFTTFFLLTKDSKLVENLKKCDTWLDNLIKKNADLFESLSDVETHWHPEEGFFTKSSEEIAVGLKNNSKDLKQAMARFTFYINRAGSNLSADDKSRLEQAKVKLSKLYKSTFKDFVKSKSE